MHSSPQLLNRSGCGTYKNVCNIINWLMAFVPLGIRIQLDLICNKLFKSRHYV